MKKLYDWFWEDVVDVMITNVMPYKQFNFHMWSFVIAIVVGYLFGKFN